MNVHRSLHQQRTIAIMDETAVDVQAIVALGGRGSVRRRIPGRK